MLDHAATARKITWMAGNVPGLASDIERALRDAEREGRREREAEVAQLRAALGKIAAMPIEPHTCRDNVMRDIAAAALHGGAAGEGT